MAKQDDMSDWKSSARGESAWKETRDRGATRNDAVRKSGKIERQDYERERESTKQAATAKRRAEAQGRS